MAFSSVRTGTADAGTGRRSRIDTYTQVANARANRPSAGLRIRCHRMGLETTGAGVEPVRLAAPAAVLAGLHVVDSTAAAGIGTLAVPACRSATCNSTV